LGITWLRVLAEELNFYTKLIAQSFMAAGISGQKWLELTFIPFRVMFSAQVLAVTRNHYLGFIQIQTFGELFGYKFLPKNSIFTQSS
jgi:hypothetical protein